jgi:hypothetical protein
MKIYSVCSGVISNVINTAQEVIGAAVSAGHTQILFWVRYGAKSVLSVALNFPPVVISLAWI